MPIRRDWHELLGVHAGELTQKIGEVVIYLIEEENTRTAPGKVIYNCPLTASPRRVPVEGSFENGWPDHIQQRVLGNWHTDGYR